MSKTCLAEYLWIDGDGNVRSKTKVCHSIVEDDFNSVNYFPEWNYDGSSTKQAEGRFSEVIISPVSVYNDPFRSHVSNATCKLVLCETFKPDGTRHETNTRIGASELFNKDLSLEPKFGIEQEFFLVNSDRIPIGFEHGENNTLVTSQRAQGDYYCGTGSDNAIGRKCIDEAFNNCLYAGLSLTGMNAEVAPAQWEFQVCANGIAVSDELYVMRYILKRTAEMHGMSITFDPKPVEGEWNGSGCHTNFSTKPMRSEGGKQVILDAIEKLSKKHTHHMSNYGVGNDRRMTGEYETSDYSTFSYGVADRGASIRIPTVVEKEGKGYFEDRRPSSNMDPYVVTSLLFETTSLN